MDALFQSNWILKQTLGEETYETISPSAEVWVTTAPPKQPEVDSKGGSCLRTFGRFRWKIGRFRWQHQHEIRHVVYVVLIVAYAAYFTAAMQYEFGSEASVRLLWLTMLAVFICLMSLCKSFMPGIRIPPKMHKFGIFLRSHRRILTVYVYICQQKYCAKRMLVDEMCYR